MATKKDTGKLAETVAKMDSSQFEAIMKLQGAQSKKEEELVSKLIAHKFKGELKETKTPLTRKEKRLLKESGLNIKEFQFMIEEELEELIDKLIELRGVQEADDIEYSELNLWTSYIILRTIKPLEFEGN